MEPRKDNAGKKTTAKAGKKHLSSVKKKISFPELFLAAIILIGIANIAYMYSLSKGPSYQKLPELGATIIYAPDCEKCFNISVAISAIKLLGAEVNVKETLDVSSNKAASLIQKYNITKIPTVVLSGKIEKYPELNTSLLSAGRLNPDGTIVLTAIPPPYYGTAEKKVIGIVGMTIVEDPACESCYDITNDVVTQLEGAGVVFGEKKGFVYSDPQGKEIISKYNLESIPSIILSKDISAYGKIAEGLSTSGTFESDGSFVIRTTVPPYRNVSTGKISGIVGVTYIVDQSCNECYDATIHKTILQRLGIYIGNESAIDVNTSAGKALLTKYDIRLVPTIILSKDASDYKIMDKVWPQVGTVEPDGSYIFRNISAMGETIIYKNLTGGNILGK